MIKGLVLWLGSVASLIALPLIVAPVIARILIEEHNLRENLAGYSEYTTRVPHRLVPLVW